MQKQTKESLTKEEAMETNPIQLRYDEFLKKAIQPQSNIPKLLKEEGITINGSCSTCYGRGYIETLSNENGSTRVLCPCVYKALAKKLKDDKRKEKEVEDDTKN